MGFGYKHDFVKEQHEALAELLKASPHPWVLSYDDQPDVRRLYAGHVVEEVQWQYSCAPGHKTNGKHELIITSDATNDDGSRERRRSGFAR
jgi:site-specific DNA-adenine methylase